MKTLKSIIITIFSFMLIADTNIFASASNDEAAINAVTAEYLKLKDALVKSNYPDAMKAANAMKLALKKVKATDTDTKKFLAAISVDLEDLSKASNLEQKRIFFKTLSDNLYNLVAANFSQTLYRQYCPMAFESKGAYWISAEKEVRNPYFGDAMLKCGKVVEILN